MNTLPIPKQALIIGQGSIGRRHARLLTARGLSVAAVTRQTDTGLPSFKDIAEAVRATAPDYAVIATATADHLAGVATLAQAGFTGRLLVEKPFAAASDPFPEVAFARLGVAYNLRFHPVLDALRLYLREDPPLVLAIHCGQHLSEWRPGRDYRQGYSADAAQGGGVLRDLSHDLNYLEWLAGPVVDVAAMGGNLGILGIKADEAWAIVLRTRSGTQCSVTLNYLDRPARRQMAVTTARATLTADLVASTLTINGDVTQIPVDRDTTYVALHEAMLGDHDPRLCSLQVAQQTDRLIAAIERAALSHTWITP
jgi:predicted dehydrogenase